ncbi:MAG: HAD hydrolase family protein [Clostridia bacterium]|nr:HAD hydrolase family protein [Clostridia bacterium]
MPATGIFGNGNQIIDLKTGKEIYKKLLTLEEINKCISIAKENDLHVHIYTDKEVITEKLEYMDLRNFKIKKQSLYDSSLDFIMVNDIAEYISGNNVEVCKLVISSSNSLNDIKENINSNLDVSITTIKKYGEYKDNIINKEYEYLDITPKNVNKDNALKILQKYLNINSNEVMAIGDNLNDLDMVKNSGIGVSVANRI